MSVDNTIIANRRALLIRSQEENFPYSTSICGFEFEIDRGVFSPKYFESSHIFSEAFPYSAGEKILEVGCGCGVTSILAAKRGASSVLACDITHSALENTKLNALLYHVEDKVEVRESDVYSSIESHEKFDTIYCNLPWIYVGPEYKIHSKLEFSLFDPGYRLVDRLVREGRQHLANGGRLIIGIANFGNVNKLITIVKDAKYKINRFLERKSGYSDSIKYYLYEFR
uniref:Methyltransferase small domain-containing protein n=1 Tax=Candidatus Kentrum sp. FW TaxID=2126338 RepID=A0A450SEI1_9GAMM|nr:MAG: Methyltransferase small domain-containing protein [Candidatus Kentron sp. FW]